METSLQRRAEALARGEQPLSDVCRSMDALLRQHVDYVAAAWSTHDPATGLSTSCTLTGIGDDSERESAIFQHEFHVDEPSTYLDLIADGRTVAILSNETSGDLGRAARWREVFKHFGVTDELRAIAWTQRQAWGSISLYRTSGTFDEDEASIVEGIAGAAAEAIRLALLRAAASKPEAVEDPPGILDVGVDGHVTPVTDPAMRWLGRGGEQLATAARVAASAVRANDDWAGAGSRVITPDGLVLALHAASTTRDDGSVAVIVEAARPAQVGAMLVDAYGLTDRQRQVLGLILLGRSMTQVAGMLGITEHTANDHRKAIYRSVGVASRSELAALMQAEQYDPRARSGLLPSPYGGFLG